MLRNQTLAMRIALELDPPPQASFRFQTPSVVVKSGYATLLLDLFNLTNVEKECHSPLSLEHDPYQTDSRFVYGVFALK